MNLLQDIKLEEEMESEEFEKKKKKNKPAVSKTNTLMTKCEHKLYWMVLRNC